MHNYIVCKALSKQEGPNVYCDARFLNPFFEFESAACCKKKRIKKKHPKRLDCLFSLRLLNNSKCVVVV